MRKIIIFILATALLSSCQKETEPMDGSVSTGQISKIKSIIFSYSSGLDAFRNTMVYSDNRHWDFGYPSLIIEREMLGQDIAYPNIWGTWWYWYEVSYVLGTDYVAAQAPWRYYYKWINQINTVVGLIPDANNASKEELWCLGKAHFYRAFAYFDLGRLYLKGNYASNPQGLTVPVLTEKTINVTDNPRVPADELYDFILSDLEKAKEYLNDFNSSDKNLPSLKAIYGMFARVYLEIGNWYEAEQYAKLAQQGLSVLTESQWLDHTHGFNTPNNNSSWIFCVSTTANDAVVKASVRNWVAHMSNESNYGYSGPGGEDYKFIDKHLYDLIPSTDFRKKSYVKPGATPAEIESDYPYKSYLPEYASLKFRTGGGSSGYDSFLVGSSVSVPLMRVEEMILIEAEAAARQDLARGRQIFNNFVHTRDIAYNSTASSVDILITDIWTQRRIELWGEGFAPFDLKRLNKGITRSYTGSNHPANLRFNTDKCPSWLNYCIVRTEIENNIGINPDENNPSPATPPVSPPAW